MTSQGKHISFLEMPTSPFSPHKDTKEGVHTHTHTQTGGFAWPTFEHHSVAAGLRHLEAPGSYSVCAEKWRQGRKVGLRKKSLP